MLYDWSLVLFQQAQPFPDDPLSYDSHREVKQPHDPLANEPFSSPCLRLVAREKQENSSGLFGPIPLVLNSQFSSELYLVYTKSTQLNSTQFYPLNRESKRFFKMHRVHQRCEERARADELAHIFRDVDETPDNFDRKMREEASMAAGKPFGATALPDVVTKFEQRCILLPTGSAKSPKGASKAAIRAIASARRPTSQVDSFFPISQFSRIVPCPNQCEDEPVSRE